MKRIALGISCWNRPQYFQQLIKSLESNVLGLENIDSHLFIDGNACAFTNEKLTEQKLIDECIATWDKALLPHKQIHKRFLNIGTGIHQYEMMQFLTNVYEKIIFLEDDVVVSPNFVAIMKNLLNKYESDNSIFSISPSFKLMCKPNETEKYKNVMKFSEGHFWAEAIWSHKWKRILPKYLEYINIIYERPYRSRDSQRIKDLFIRGGRGMLATSQDNAKDWAISQTEMKRARLVVNRATGIGDEGIHSTKAKLAQSGDGHNQIYVFNDDPTIDFVLI
jgi:hypothetical protein